MANRQYARDVVHRNWNWHPDDHSYRVIITASLLHIARCVERMAQRMDAIYHDTKPRKASPSSRKRKKPATKPKTATRKR